MIVYAAQYNPCTHESAYGTISLHKTRAGAEKVIKRMRAEELIMWTGLGYDDIPDYQVWQVREFEVKE